MMEMSAACKDRLSPTMCPNFKFELDFCRAERSAYSRIGAHVDGDRLRLWPSDFSLINLKFKENIVLHLNILFALIIFKFHFQIFAFSRPINKLF